MIFQKYLSVSSSHLHCASIRPDNFLPALPLSLLLATPAQLHRLSALSFSLLLQARQASSLPLHSPSFWPFQHRLSALSFSLFLQARQAPYASVSALNTLPFTVWPMPVSFSLPFSCAFQPHRQHRHMLSLPPLDPVIHSLS